MSTVNHFRLSPSESITYREAMARFISQHPGPEARKARRLRAVFPEHAPYDLHYEVFDWQVATRVLNWVMRDRLHNAVLARKAGAIYARMYRKMRFPAEAPEPVIIAPKVTAKPEPRSDRQPVRKPSTAKLFGCWLVGKQLH